MLLALCAVPGLAASHADLVTLYDDFRKGVAFPVVAGVPDHGAAAMARRAAVADRTEAALLVIDSTGWTIPERADHLLVLAEARGVRFQHRILRQWQRDPSWWATLDIGWGPKVDTAFAPPKLPLKDAAARRTLAARLATVPATLAAARASLTDMRGDLVGLGITHHDIETRLYTRMAGDLAKTEPALAARARTAARASADFAAWLRATRPALPAAAGIGRPAMDWYLRHVLLFPYGYDEMKAIGEREWERSMTFLKIEEHEHKALPMIAPVTSLAAFEALRREADTDLLAFLKSRDIMTVPDWLTVPEPEGPYVMPANQDPSVPGPFDPPINRNFFREAEDRDPRTLRAHNLPGHNFDMLWRARDPRPIRRDARLGFAESSRVEGWAFYLEEMVVQAGWLDDRPKAREIHYILMANRAARLLPELKVQANEWSFDAALASLAGRTPYWMEKDDDTALYDMALYLRQPGLGLNYYFGKTQLEQLLAEVALKEGRSFNLKRFHDRFIASGLVPIALTRWEMTGNDDQVRTMWQAPPIP
ncbi:DUF885 family protein [Sandarakinorhabdus sp. DWP1-3-1]|uniref:DUF885 family protein n=1 Tax=Sandarakinorhabdus sp. DWP1-3-1 TaxID=2804627 RepID=UPI003CF72CB6